MDRPKSTDILDLNILAVEDQLPALRLLKSILADIGIRQVYTARTGKEALAFLGDCETMTDVILCDWNMPGMTGLDLLRQVRTVNPDIPFLMVTGASDRDSVFQAKENGVTRCPIRDVAEAAEDCPVDFKTVTPDQARAAVESFMQEQSE